MFVRIGSRIRTATLSVGVLCCGVFSAAPAEISVDVGLPSAAIGLHVQQYPNLVPVPRYPVYYAAGLNSNLFFYDGQYWVYAQDNWYTSTWYNGPWDFVPPETVPDFVLRVPLLYYRRPPAYFSGWNRESPPHWGEHWGRGWEDRRRGWDHWTSRDVPKRAPPPAYQRDYSHEYYPRVEEQRALRERNYRYEPRQEMTRHQLDRPQSGAMDPNRTGEPYRAPAVRPRPDAPPRNSPDSRSNSGDRQPQNHRDDIGRRGSPSPPVGDAIDANRALPGHPVPRHGNPQIPERHGAHERAVPSPGPKSPGGVPKSKEFGR
jgi:hypothetical protein